MTSKSKHFHNFHFGFWNTFLMSLFVMLQSTLLIFASTTFSTAQTTNQIMTFSVPTQGQSFQPNEIINWSAVSSSNFVPQFDINVIDSQSTIVFVDSFNPQAGNIVFDGKFSLNQPGNYTLILVDQSNNPISDAISININNTVSISVDTLVKNDVLSDQALISSSVTGNVSSVEYIFSDNYSNTTKTYLPILNTSNNKWEYQYDISTDSLPYGDYQFTANALDSTGLVLDSVTIPNIISVENNPLVLTSHKNNQTISGSQNFLIAAKDSNLSGVTIQLDNTSGNTQQIIQTSQNRAKLNIFSANQFNTQTIPNGIYAVVIYGDTPSGRVFSPTIQLNVNNVGVTPLSITTISLPDAEVGVAYNHVLSATGGSIPYVWSLDNTSSPLPSGLMLSTNGILSGIPTTITPTSATANLTVKVTDSNNSEITKQLALNVKGTVSNPNNNSSQQNQNTNTNNNTNNQSTVDLTFNSPNANAVIAEGDIVSISSSTILNDAPEFTLLSNSNAPIIGPVEMTKKSAGLEWELTLPNLQNQQNGQYTILVETDNPQARTTRTVQINNTQSLSQQEEFSATLSIPTQPITKPETIKIRVDVNQSDLVRSVVVNVSAPSGTTPITLTKGAGDFYEALWSTASATPGTIRFSARIIGPNLPNGVVTLPTKNIVLLANQSDLNDSNTTQNTSSTTNQNTQFERPDLSVEEVAAQKEIEEKIQETVDPKILSNRGDDGSLNPLPIQCQVAGVTTQSECDDFLAKARIELLDENEEEQVKESLRRVTGKTIQIENGKVLESKNLTDENKQEADKSIKTILPINIEKAKNVDIKILPSTEPPEYIKPFVEQTVPGLIIFDSDGDGLSDDAEARYGTNPNNPDTDNDGWDDGTEIKNLFNPLGSGSLNIEVAPIDRAILTGQALDQPRFAGAFDNQNYVVNLVESVLATQSDSDKLKITGKAPAKSVVTLYIYSSLPIVVSVSTNESGNFEYTLDEPLVDGKHDVYVTINDDTGKIKKKSNPFSFFVQEAKAVSEEEYLAGAIEVESSTDAFIQYYILGGIILIILAGGVFIFYFKKKTSHI